MSDKDGTLYSGDWMAEGTIAQSGYAPRNTPVATRPNPPQKVHSRSRQRERHFITEQGRQNPYRHRLKAETSVAAGSNPRVLIGSS